MAVSVCESSAFAHIIPSAGGPSLRARVTPNQPLTSKHHLFAKLLLSPLTWHHSLPSLFQGMGRFLSILYKGLQVMNSFHQSVDTSLIAVESHALTSASHLGTQPL